MINFTHGIKLWGANIQKNIEVPAGATGVILGKADMLTIALTSPAEFKGIIVRGPLPAILECAEIIEEPGEEIRMGRRKGGNILFGDEFMEDMRYVVNQLKKRGEDVLASEIMDYVTARTGKSRTFRLESPYDLKKWYKSSSSNFPVFFLVSFKNPSFYIREPDKNERPIQWEDMQRANPTKLSIEEAEELGIDFKPEEMTS